MRLCLLFLAALTILGNSEKAEAFGGRRWVMDQQYAETKNPPKPSSVIPDDKTVELFEANSQQKDWARSVGLLAVHDPRANEWIGCTGTLISESWFLTAGHCFRKDADRYRVFFEYSKASADDNPGLRKLDAYEIEGNPIVFRYSDAMLIKLQKRPGLLFGARPLSWNIPEPMTPTILIHHPAGLPKQVNFNCNFLYYTKNKNSDFPDNVDMLSSCLAQPGTSGGPLFNENGEIIAISERTEFVLGQAYFNGILNILNELFLINEEKTLDPELGVLLKKK